MSSDNEHTITDFSKTRTVLILLFSWSSVFTLKVMQMFVAPFYLTFLKDRKLNTTIGLAVNSGALITMLVGPYVAQMVPAWKRLPLWARTGLCLVLSVLSNVALLSVDYVTNDVIVYTILAVCRFLTGVFIGVLFVEGFGEVVDRFIVNKTVVTPVVTSAIHISFTVSTITGAQTYTAGKWTLAATANTAFALLPLALLPIIRDSERRIVRALSTPQTTSTTKTDDQTSTDNTELTDEQNSTADPQPQIWMQRVVFYLPDLVAFCNGYAIVMMVYVATYRATQYSGMTLEKAALIVSLIFIVGFVSSFIVSFLNSRLTGRQIFPLLWVLVTMFWSGCIMLYGSTSIYLPSSLFLPGALLAGLGTASHTNLTVPAQFALYKAWGLPNEGLAKRGAGLFNVMVSAAGFLATYMAGLVGSRESELPTLVAMVTTFVVVMASLIICWAVCLPRPGEWREIPENNERC